MGSIKLSEEYLKVQDVFRHNALVIINQMLAWSKSTQGSKHLVDEMLHSIFFLGGINTPKYEPKDIIDNEVMLERLKRRYPRPLLCYSSQLPMRSPFSCVLDMIVLQEGQDQVDTIKNRLQEFVGLLKPGFLVSSTLCVTTCKKSNSNYYGVSMSTEKIPYAGKIMIAASCLSAWEEYVAGAVMTYYPKVHQEKPEKNTNKHKKKSCFDGTIQLPPHLVTCQASNIRNQKDMNPCTLCENLFGLSKKKAKRKEKKERIEASWLYGHCAEAESVSNLLKEEKDVKEAAKPTSSSYTAENRERAEDSVRRALRQLLREVKYQKEFYEPQN
ncbi:uncharacterized protein LOC129602879 [Betta splendens]|uniref:Uncharacterized protein LOC129602879 n=1 Tax=Betta splendens TaxID=158456 RepID=A0A6P7NZF9_BETSP|nr:uncharacterized protein LOC129602879 [Betta splendens]